MRGETIGGSDAAAIIGLFQSTPLMRGETWEVNHLFTIFKFQSTPLMRGETYSDLAADKLEFISIHSPHARGDSVNRR